jgi:predicted dinucleotide-binding enzyme
MAMTIGIIGADDRAVAIGRMLHHCGHIVTFSSPHGAHAAEMAAHALGGDASARTTYEQAATSEALVLAVHWEELDGALMALGDYKDGIVIDATRPPERGDGGSGAEVLAHRLDNRHVVKAFVDVTDPREPIRIASDDPEARMRVEEIIRNCGGIVEDMGPLAQAVEIEREFARKIPVR